MADTLIETVVSINGREVHRSVETRNAAGETTPVAPEAAPVAQTGFGGGMGMEREDAIPDLALAEASSAGTESAPAEEELPRLRKEVP